MSWIMDTSFAFGELYDTVCVSPERRTHDAEALADDARLTYTIVLIDTEFTSPSIVCRSFDVGDWPVIACDGGMSSVTQVLKSVGPKLVPFFKSVSVYFVLLAEQPSLLTACIKCLPIISLIFFVLLHGMNLSEEYTFSRRILAGLVFSCMGDALIVWPSLFLAGMGMFALAQIMYITAFGFVPLNATLGASLYAVCSLVIYTLMPGLNGVLAIGVPVYTALLATMTWRAVSRVQSEGVPWTWTKLCGGIGSVSFAISDTLLGFHHFYSPLPYATVTVMLTYYAAQLGIALSTVDSRDKNKSLAKR